MARFFLASCVLAVYLVYTFGSGDMGGGSSGGDTGGSGGSNCASQQKCPNPENECTALGDTYELNPCTTLTCTVADNVYGLTGAKQCAYNGGCFDGGHVETIGNCDYNCSTSGIIGFVKVDDSCS